MSCTGNIISKVLDKKKQEAMQLFPELNTPGDLPSADKGEKAPTDDKDVNDDAPSKSKTPGSNPKRRKQ